jgi:F-box/leucine-rich repeat protein 10/11
MRYESSFDDDYIHGDVHARHSLPNQFSAGSSLLQDIAFSAQQALARGDDDLVPVDPALQAFADGAYSALDTTPSYAQNGEDIVSSIEQQAEGDIPMNGLTYGPQNGDSHPSVEALTPGPPPRNDTMHVQAKGNGNSNGHPASDTTHIKANGFASQPSLNNAVRHPSSPVSPRRMSVTSPGTRTYNTYMTSPTMHHNIDYNFTTDTDFPPPPATPAANPHRTSRRPNSSGRKTNQTPSRTKTSKSTPCARRQDGIKLEAGLGLGMSMMGIDMDMIDPNLDQASQDLIKQLQAEERGLRRRS